MNMEEIGRVYHYLLKHRSIESRPSQRRSRPDENIVASILRSASIDQLDQFNEFLNPQGFKLVEFDDTTRGVSTAGRVWVLARNGEIPASSFVSTDRVHTDMNLRNESREQTSVWFLHIWLIYLSLIYTRTGRGVSEVSSYIDGTFSREALEAAVAEHIESIRNTGASEGAQLRVIDILDAEKGKDVPRRVQTFLKLMVSAGLIMEVSSDEYQQTLLGAYEIAEQYDQSLRIPVENTLSSLVNIVTPDNSMSEGEGKDQWD